MKTKPSRSHRYADYGAPSEKENQYVSRKSTFGSLLSPTEGTDREEKIIAGHAPPKLPVKVRPAQQFRQDRIGKSKLSKAVLEWRTNGTSQRNVGLDKH